MEKEAEKGRNKDNGLDVRLNLSPVIKEKFVSCARKEDISINQLVEQLVCDYIKSVCDLEEDYVEEDDYIDDVFDNPLFC